MSLNRVVTNRIIVSGSWFRMVLDSFINFRNKYLKTHRQINWKETSNVSTGKPRCFHPSTASTGTDPGDWYLEDVLVLLRMDKQAWDLNSLNDKNTASMSCGKEKGFKHPGKIYIPFQVR